MSGELYKRKEWLEEQLSVNKLNLEAISSLCGVHASTVSRWARRFGILYMIVRPLRERACDVCGALFGYRTRKSSGDGKYRCPDCVAAYRRECNRSRRRSKRGRTGVPSITEHYPRIRGPKKASRLTSAKTSTTQQFDAYTKKRAIDNGKIESSTQCAACGVSLSDARYLDYDNSVLRGVLCDTCGELLSMLRCGGSDRIDALLTYLLPERASLSWESYFMWMAFMVSTRSKDRSTKVGAVIVRDKVIIATGYNGFPRKCDDRVEARYERPLKYDWTVHAEENAILNAARAGLATIDSTLYVTPLLPCHNCAKSIIQAGIKRVVCKVASKNNTNWEESFKLTKIMFDEAQIEFCML